MKPPSPSPITIRSARLVAGLTQVESAALVGAATRTVQQWEGGQRNMPSSKWDLWRINARLQKKQPR